MSRPLRSRALALCVVLIATGINLVTGQAQGPLREPEAFLRKYIRLSAAEQTAMQRGDAVAKLVQTSNKRELAVGGVVRLAVPRDDFVSKIRDIVRYKTNDAILQIGRFSDPPRIEDLAGLTMEPADLASLKKCKLGNCGLRMPAAEIERFRTEIDWTRKDSNARATLLARQMILQYVKAYLAGGDSALAEYHDRKRALSLADESRSLMAASLYLLEYAPEFHSYLEKYPAGQLEKVENLIYWSKEKFGLKPVVSVTHMTIYTVTRDGVANVIVSSKQLYASRYFESSFALTVFVEVAEPGPSPASYLIYLNRSRTDLLGGILGGAKRSIVESGMVRGVKKTLLVTKNRLEKDFRERLVTSAAVGDRDPSQR